jgi:hypothetical protein
MIDCNLSFEKSSVEAEIIGHIDSVKNAESGRIIADTVGEIIAEFGSCKITENRKEYATN